MQGHVKTPAEVADWMVQLLFDERQPSPGEAILYPGCGDEGPFISAVLRYCENRGLPIPEGVAFETHPERFHNARERFSDESVLFRREDFLQEALSMDRVEYVIGNPPYIPISDIESKDEYKERFRTARGRFDLYILFFEQALRLLTDNGRLCFITPEKFEYTNTAGELRRLLTSNHVERIEHQPEDLFGPYATYPVITVVENSSAGVTTVLRRDGSEDVVTLPTDGGSWASTIRGGDGDFQTTGVTLNDVTERISPGIATGRDGIFVQPRNEIAPQLVEEGWVYPTTSAKQLGLNDGPRSGDFIICPYDEEGNLVPEDDLGVFGEWANKFHRSELESRSCVKNGKPWYSWHENPPMDDVLGRPKIVYRDLAKEPKFWLDADGEILPRHSVYYIIPNTGVDIHELVEYLESPIAQTWFEAHCHRASNGYYRFQSTVIKDLPVPERFSDTIQTTI